MTHPYGNSITVAEIAEKIALILFLFFLAISIATSAGQQKDSLTLADIRSGERLYAVGELLCKLNPGDNQETDVLIIINDPNTSESLVIVVNGNNLVEAITVPVDFNGIECRIEKRRSD
ncbi:MAG: hypothetical protein A2418_02070 [Candidatus Brennerbacteria bacterium RIFOXYC1_FULL_41_11]|uniref:Uncharacterized protein n=1 Tax=Candidatus Brennerbacteria bacterium RIFOXYD1_FULL_41_16 TaxID=1797529 RepID=A0A1G1XM53_9BACT|nr:MAG: hypothetical protein A2391_01425 [Candidatus Brennerbacteria bacterium RIFOXYB1_FULL_41_13]OGY39935.1 MAG: hypothetical protein A2418_02070 [Candidatus Brennerbacteria bacterium RIFOXYC1_FULL_41_11]OGY40746.1 MAG: hypothetical protein A2570_01285 [Candidatus Brennerbacteria bacterium RIFOXYD1_FULL_41_16]